MRRMLSPRTLAALLILPASSWLIVFLCLVGLTAKVTASTNLSTWVAPGQSGRLLYSFDALGNRIIDQSAVGYQGGGVPIPNVPAKINVSPVVGDDGANIQSAIEAVKTIPLDQNGFRGAVLLSAGEYDIAGSITIDTSGIVLRGAGDGTNGTILRASGNQQRTLIKVMGFTNLSFGVPVPITNTYVPVGARSFNVNSTAGLSAGSRVLIMRKTTSNWLHDIGMDLLANPWPAGAASYLERRINRIEGDRITLDAPLTDALAAKYGGGAVVPYTWPGRIDHVGIENIRAVSDFTGPEDEAHAWDFIGLYTVENAWVRQVTSEHFGHSCVLLGFGTEFATVRDCRSLDPVSQITGERRYAFLIDRAQYCLVQNCYATKDRHHFVLGGTTLGPNVFVDGLSETAYNDAGPHQRWATGAMWDNVTITGNSINVQNRGNSGTGHGWAGANMLIWNSKADSFVVQNPPTARNWLIGSIGEIKAGTMYVGPHDPGTYDSHGVNVFPNSLYYAQLQDRLAAPGLETREYFVGEINQFVTTAPAGTAVPVDPGWLAQLQVQAATADLSGFDRVTNNQFVPFSFSFALASNERILAATLAIAMRAYAPSDTSALYLDSTNNPIPFSALAWLPIGTGTNTTVRVVDLHEHLPLLADGQLNVALRDNVGIDWAMLELHVAPVQTYYTNSVAPVTDTYVRGGSHSGINYGEAGVLEVQLDTSPDNRRQSYLRWNLSGYPAAVQHARLRLIPVSVGLEGVENGISSSLSTSWQESSLRWTNQPGGGQRFATWIPRMNIPVEIAVTTQVQEALSGDGQLSIEIFSLKNVGSSGLVSYASREDPDAAKRPLLLIVCTNRFTLINSCALEPGNVLRITGSGPLDQPFRILSATNITTAPGEWIPLDTGVFSAAGFTFSEILTGIHPQRYYRLVTP